MNHLKRLFRFLGSLPFALCLIAMAALLVLIGTFIESKTQSHLLAARYTYAHPLFYLLLGGFFINILFSAMLRWPFQKKHVPFLMTHLGLLMILAGTMIKNRFGLQGQLLIREGSSQQEVLIPHTQALYLEKKGQDSSSTIQTLVPLKEFQENTMFTPFPGLTCIIKGYAPHVKEEFETWIKGSKAYLFGLPPLPVHHWHSSLALPEARLATLPSSSSLWNLLALNTSDVQVAIQQLYLKELNLHLVSKINSSDTLTIPLEEALRTSFAFAGGIIETALSFSKADLEENESPFIQLTWKKEGLKKQESLLILLQGADALYNQPIHPSSKASFIADLERPHPSLCLIEDREKKIFLLSFDQYGKVEGKIFDPSRLETIIAYDQGFAGYTLQTIGPVAKSRKEKEEADQKQLQEELERAFVHNPSLSPPLLLFKQACEKVKADFPSQLVAFLAQWEMSPDLLFHPVAPLSPSLEQVLQALPWEEIPSKEREALPWIHHLFNQLEQGNQEGKDFLTILHEHHWPFLEELKQTIEEKGEHSLLSIIAQQLFSIAPSLPPLSRDRFLERHASLLSAYLKAYDIDYYSLSSFLSTEPLDSGFLLETPLTTHIFPEEPPLKPEEHRPGLVLEVEEGGHKQLIALAYDSSLTGLKWPILKGKYVIRFQPELRKIPYLIQLKEARRLTYPDSTQVYSYESDLWIAEEGKPPSFQALSMNHVHETWEGYRFYLAGVGESADHTLKNIQLVVNYDPVKYLLTYPGAGLVFLGIFFLFWRPYQYKK